MQEKYEELRKRLTKVGDIAMWVSISASFISWILIFLFNLGMIGGILFILSQVGFLLFVLFEQKTKDYLRELYKEYEAEKRKEDALKSIRGIKPELK